MLVFTVEEMGASANTSVSAFHERFKAVTTMSRCNTRRRLFEARRRRTMPSSAPTASRPAEA
jgi:hypothetical protein